VARHVLATVDSTNAHGLRLAAGLSGPAWFLAHEQSAGKGRRARAWASPRGNFHATLVLHPDEPAAEVALRSFAAALALREALVALTDLPQAFTLKWPNDVLLNGGKVAGILLESQGGTGGRIAHLAIGIGVNLIAAPDPALIEPGATRPVTLLQETGLRVTPEQLLAHLAPAYAALEARFVAEGFGSLRAEWLTHAARLGELITARTGAQTREGRFETIDSSGALVLFTSQGRQAIPAAEVFFP
jgi:BirA family transcriptional regulator, biotin operon repressor / biotin---[acetyl-CoA-carboxylase] ligase